ncbi:UDP-N-acetylglucosamine--N-acetylmuramyl-(pentapeptide) pyrophosphoryl-undecaprenol N-acetylglucosamine transferase, partial [Candidatus Peregrinibacteria bacterium]|nr:UDP-N-acetylglucosamine--N-acetylmuramyl-(pentapeptide) pyrophosphoryl-undecaprenol N-acetylglucosamine transferase [Candidatus Peregrinibacteria bacterium]
YFACEFIGAELKDVYAITDLIISRAGANSLAEIAFLQKPAILVPLVVGSRGDQVSNAESFAKSNPVAVLDEKGIDYHQLDLLGRIEQLFKLPISQENSADADASARIVELILKTVTENGTKKA